MDISKDEFLREYSGTVLEGNAALFIGAGLSSAAGYVDWRGLLRDMARDLGLTVDREPDLVALAQYYINHKGGCRDALTRILIHQFARAPEPTENHRILARLPIGSIWTTNYDSLIETALRDAGKNPDVKVTNENITQTWPGRDPIVYKMHGDIGQPQDTVIAKDDYERYETTHPLFIQFLKAHLITKTFLFVGFSFADPNLEYVLRHIRVLLREHQRTHYCIMRRPPLSKQSSQHSADSDYERRKLEHRIQDLKRFAIETVLVDEYSEITAMLKAISKQAHKRNIFVSGSAHNYGSLGRARLLSLSREIGQETIARGYNLISGFGRGIGDQVILGALRSLHAAKGGVQPNRVVLRPFPRLSGTTEEQAQINTRHREDLISQSGTVIFVCGNREYDGKIGNSKGVLEEYRIAQEQGRTPIPIGCTGHAAQWIWKDVMRKIDVFYPTISVKQSLHLLQHKETSNGRLVEAIFDIIEKIVASGND